MNKDTLLKMIIDDIDKDDEIKFVKIKSITRFNEKNKIVWGEDDDK